MKILLSLFAATVITVFGFGSPLYATNQIKGNLTCIDGITLITKADAVTVEAIDATSSASLFTITYPTESSYIISWDEAKLPENKAVKITYKLAGVVDRVIDGINGNSERPTQFLDVCMNKEGVKTNAVTKCIIKGSLYYKDGVTAPIMSDIIKIEAKDASGKVLMSPQILGKDWAFSIDPKQLPSNKTVNIAFTLNGTLRRQVQGLSGTDVRTQVFDIVFDK